jgi:hypothetical protein
MMAPFCSPDDELAKLVGGVQVGGDVEIHGNHRALGGADGGEVVVLRDRRHTWVGLRPKAASRSGFSQMRIAKMRAPTIWALCTPETAVSLGCTTRYR